MLGFFQKIKYEALQTDFGAYACGFGCVRISFIHQRRGRVSGPATYGGRHSRAAWSAAIFSRGSLRSVNFKLANLFFEVMMFYFSTEMSLFLNKGTSCNLILCT